MRFKRGDKVTINDTNYSFNGKVGTVVKEGNYSEEVVVDWPNEYEKDGIFRFSVPEYGLELVEDTPKYKEGVWYGWTGGDCPVPSGTKVSVMFSDGDVDVDEAEGWDWSRESDHPIICFRVDFYGAKKVFVGWHEGVFMSDENLFERATHIFHEDGTLELIKGG